MNNPGYKLIQYIQGDHPCKQHKAQTLVEIYNGDEWEMEVVDLDKIKFTCRLCESIRVYQLLPGKNTIIMLGETLNSMLIELTELVKNQNQGTVILKTDFLPVKIGSYKMPLLILDVLEAPESMQLLGGITQMEWVLALNSYNYEPDPYNVSQTGYQPGLLNIIDTIRQHFSIGAWLTSGMTDLENNYGTRFTLSGIQPADALEHDGLVLGFRIIFDTMSFDVATASVVESASTLNIIIQDND